MLEYGVSAKGNVSVIFGDKIVGHIVPEGERFTFHPKNFPGHGDVFPTIQEVKDDLMKGR